MILDEFLSAINYLYVSSIISIIFYKVYSSEHPWDKVFKDGFMYCLVVSIGLAALFGRPTCIEKDYDGINCLEYADDGFETTDAQHISKFVFYFTLTFSPVLLGLYLKKTK